MIYILGGAFDPPHVGHAAIVRALLYFRDPQKIVIMPSGKRNDKEYSTSDEDRLALLEIFVNEIGDPRLLIDDYFISEWK